MATNLTISDVFTPASLSSWQSTLLGALGTLNLPATQWQSGGIARTIVALMAQTAANEDGLISLAAQGGFLDFAATGTVTYTTAQGTTVTVPVTPDPSTLTGAALASWQPGWLDILADGSYNVQRISAQFANGNVAIANTTASTYGPFGAGTYHVANPSTGATFSNTSSLTIAAANLVGGGITAASNASPISVTTSSPHGLSTGQTVFISGVLGNTNANGFWIITVTGATTFTLNGSTVNAPYTSGGTVNVCTVAAFQADNIGATGTSATNAITQPVTSLVGVSCANTSPFVGSPFESNTAVVNRCRLKLQSLSPNGGAGAYQFFALSSFTLLQAATPSYTLVGGPITRASVIPQSGTVETVIANAGGPVTGATGLAVTGAVNNGSGLIRLTVNTTGLTTGTVVVVAGVGGISNAIGTWIATIFDGTHLDLQGSVFAGAYTSGGTVAWGDVGLVDSVIQQNVVPAGTTATTQSASGSSISVAATVYVPVAQVTAYKAAVATALANYFATIPIGGLATDGASNVVPYGAVEGVLYQAGAVSGTGTSYVRGVTGLLLNGGTTDVTLTATQVATLGTTTITVVGQ